MGDSVDKNIEALGKLILLTQKGKIEWNPANPSSVRAMNPDDVIQYVFLCEYKNKFLRIYQRKYKAPQNTFGVSVLSSWNDRSEMAWHSEVILELTTRNGESVWQFPKGKILNDLLESVRYKTSGAHDVINNLLEEE